MKPLPSELQPLIERGLRELGIERPAAPWVELATLIERWGRRLNLTGHGDAQRIARSLLLEAAALAQALPETATLADVGSGAGIPGLPIALCRPSTRVLLIESRERRHHFQRAAIRALGLRNVEALHGRAESLPAQPCDLVISQAFAEPSRALEWMLPWAKPEGWVALATVPGFAGPEHPRLVESELRPYAAPNGPRRALWLGRLGPRGAESRTR